MIPVLHGVWAAAGGLVGDYEHIETVTVGAGGTASVTFSSIPGTYKHLQIRGLARASAGDSVISAILNSDTNSANYRAHIVKGDGATASSSSWQNTYVMINGYAGSSTTFAVGVIDILDYASTTKNTTIRALSGADFNGSGQVGLISTLWVNTAAVTSIKLDPVFWGGTSLFTQYSSFSLYGVK